MKNNELRKTAKFPRNTRGLRAQATGNVIVSGGKPAFKSSARKKVASNAADVPHNYLQGNYIEDTISYPQATGRSLAQAPNVAWCVQEASSPYGTRPVINDPLPGQMHKKVIVRCAQESHVGHSIARGKSQVTEPSPEQMHKDMKALAQELMNNPTLTQSFFFDAGLVTETGEWKEHYRK